MNNDLLKYVNEFFTSFGKDHAFYIAEDRVKSYKISNTRAEWELGNDWYFLNEQEIKEVSIMSTILTITSTCGRKYTFIAKPKSKEEVTEKIVSLLKTKLTRIFYEAGIIEEIDEIIYLLNELERINKQ